MRWRTADGRYLIEHVVIDGVACLRVTTKPGPRRIWVGNYRTPEKLAEALDIDLADLEELPDE